MIETSETIMPDCQTVKSHMINVFASSSQTQRKQSEEKLSDLEQTNPGLIMTLLTLISQEQVYVDNIYL
jgi:hypothetical protein